MTNTPTPTSPAPTVATPRSGRAGPRVPWALVPVALALLYAGAHALFSARPSLEDLVPADAILTWRYADLSAYDEAHPPVEGSMQVRASEELGAQLNLPGLPGVADDRAVLESLLDPATRVDPRYFVLPVRDAAAVQKAFRDPDLRERHARRVVVHGTWAAAAWDARAAMDAGRAGSGAGVLPPLPPWARFSVTADWPRLVDAALLPWVGRHSPYAEALAALGFRPPERPSDPAAAGLPKDTVAVAHAGRVPLVRDAWSRVTLVSGPGRVELTLLPASGSELRPTLRALAARGRGAERGLGAAPTPPPDAAAHLCVPNAAARRAVVYALGYAGVAFAPSLAADDFAALRLAPAGADGAGDEPWAAGWTVAALPSPGLEPTYSFAWAGPAGPDGAYLGPDPAAFSLPPLPEVGGAVPIGGEVVPLRAPFFGTAGPGEWARARSPSYGNPPVEVVAAGGGAAAQAAAWAMSARLEAFSPSEDDETSQPVLAFGRIERLAAQRLLRRALAPGGLLSALADGDLALTLTTDGERLRLRVRRLER